MTTTFKPGDKVRCVRGHPDARWPLVEGQEYEVTRFHRVGVVEWVTLVGSTQWRADRFELIDPPPTFHAGDTVRLKAVPEKGELTIDKVRGEQGGSCYIPALGWRLPAELDLVTPRLPEITIEQTPWKMGTEVTVAVDGEVVGYVAASPSGRVTFTPHVNSVSKIVTLREPRP